MPIIKIPLFLLSRLVILIVLLGATISFFQLYERYEPVGPELLMDRNFRHGFTHWSRSGRGVAEIKGDKTVVLRASEPSADVAVRQSLANPERYSLLRLSGELKAEDIHPGDRFWHRGRLVLASFDVEQRMMSVPHLVADLEGTRPWQTYRQVFRVPERVHEMRVGIQLIGASGTLLVRNLSLREVREREHYAVYRGIGVAIWTAALIWIAIPYFSRLRLDLPHLLMYVAIAGIFAGTLMPAELKMEIDSEIGTAVSQVVQILKVDRKAEEVSVLRLVLDSLVISKLGHFLFFALLGFGVCWAYPAKHRLVLLSGLLSLALVSEVLQFFVENRLPRVADFIIDGAGIILGMALFGLLSRLLSLKKPDSI